MDVDEDNQFHSQIYPTNKYNNDAAAAATAPNSAASSAVVLAQVQADDNEHQLFRGWHNSSRIFRVSRASGGKDRHSKVLTSKGLRDRRVRLSVSTAIQFYDLQDRLGYDQPSKAVEWLIKAAADSIAELPSLHGPFPDCIDAKLGFHESAAADAESQHQQQKNLSASSTSETSKGSGLSLTRTDVRVNQRVKARERARERAKEKECESEHQTVNDGQRVRTSTTQATVANPISFSSTFTELLTGGNQSGSSPSNLNNSTAPMMDYFTNAGMISPAPSRSAACLFLGQTQMGISMNNMPPAAFHLTTGPHHQHQHDVHHFSFGHQNLIPSGNDDHQYDLNFSISQSSPSGVAAGFNNRGTLQSNSPASSLLHHHHHHHNLHQRYTNNNAAGAAAAVSMEGSNMPAFFMTSTAAMDNHHFSTGLDGGLHLYYGDHKDKGKN